MKNTDKTIPSNLDNGHVIFVKLGIKNAPYVITNIWLNESPIFQVFDKWGIDSSFNIENQNIQVKGNPILMRYNSPFTPGFLRRNEVAVEILFLK
jgi:hypothetical protein